MNECASKRTEYKALLGQAVLLVLLLVILFPDVFFRGEMIFPGDILYQSLPWSLYAPADYVRPQNPVLTDLLQAFHGWYMLTEDAFQRGEWPLWNAYELGGMPLLANMQSTVFYPLRLLYRFFDISLATTLATLIKLWLCGMASYLCGRRLRLSIAASCFLSLAWTLNGYNINWCIWPLLDVSTWLPVLLLGAEWLLAGRTRRGGITLAIAGALIILAGHPESAFGMAFGLSVYFLIRAATVQTTMRARLQTVGVWTGAWIFALLACSVQLLPFFEYLLNRSTFAERFGPRQTPNAPADILIGFLVPRFFGSSVDYNFWGEVNSLRYTTVYVGVSVLLATSLINSGSVPNFREIKSGTVPATLRFAWDSPRFNPRALTASMALSLSLALGIIPASVVRHVPVLNMMVPQYHFCFVMFALAVLGAIGIDRWFSQSRRWAETARCLWVIVPASAMVWGFIRFYGGLMSAKGVAPFVYTQVELAAITGLAGILILCGYVVWHKPRLFASLFVLLLAADLAIAARELNPTVPHRDIFPNTALTDYLQEIGGVPLLTQSQEPGSRSPARMGLAQGGIVAGVFLPYGIEDWSGFDGLYPERIITFQQELGTKIWDAMEPACAIQYYLHDPRFEPSFPLDEPGRFERIATLDGLEVYQNIRAFPRAYLVGAVEGVSDKQALFAAMRNPEYNPAQTILALSDELPPGPPLQTQSTDLGNAEITEWTPEHIKLEVDARETCALVLAESFYPGWNAAIDGQSAPLFPAYHVFRGLYIPPGRHTIEYRFDPLSFRLGMWISAITLLAGGLLTVWLYVRTRQT